MNVKREYKGDYIQGKFVTVEDANGEIISRNPGDLELPKVMFPYRFQHMNEAVNAARKSTISWKRMPTSDRFSIIARYRNLLAQKSDMLSRLISFEMGKPLWESRNEINDCLGFIDAFLKEPAVTDDIDVPETDGSCRGKIRFFPRGVMAVFAATDLPFFGTQRNLIPMLGVGNTVVLKSSKYVPSVSQAVAQTLHDAGIPAGVFNLVHGDFEMGRRLATHPEVDGILFTGSFEKSVKIKKQIATDFRKSLILETGGKNGTLIWDDCHYQKALQEVFLSVFLSSGQRHTGTRRIFVHKNIFDRFVAHFHELSKQCSVGYAFAETGSEPFLGPMISEKAVESYLRFQGMAVREGCEELMRGKALERKQRGYYVSPSIHIVLKPSQDSIFEKSELFGPNAAIYKIEDCDEAIDLMNMTQFGLVASVYSSDRNLYLQTANSVKAGSIYWNLPTNFLSNRLPWGGLKKSGNARPLGSFSKYQYTFPLSLAETPDPSMILSMPDQMPKIKNQ